MGGDDDSDMGFQHRAEGKQTCPSSGMNTNPLSEKVSGMMPMNSVPMFKSSSGEHPFFGSGWDPLVSLSQSENFGGSSMVSHCQFANSPYPVVMGSQGISSHSNLVQYPQSDSSLIEMVPKLPCFGSGSFSEMVGSFGLPECAQNANTVSPQYYSPNKEGKTGKTSTNAAHSQEDCQISEEGASPSGKRRKRVLESHSIFNANKSAEGEHQKDHSGESTELSREQDEKKLKTEQVSGANLRGKQTGKQAKDNSQSGEDPKENYIHMRARRGQATNSHSLAERVRREKISERMRMLQELVPGCNKITGKAVMLDEIINYVQSLQQQVEFLSMKLATINPELNIDIERILSKDILHSRGGNASILGIRSGMSSSNPYPHGILPGNLPGGSSTVPQFFPMPQTVWDNELQNLLQMGFDSNPAIDNLGTNGSSKSEL